MYRCQSRTAENLKWCCKWFHATEGHKNFNKFKLMHYSIFLLHQFNSSAVKFAILLLCVVDILLSISMSSSTDWCWAELLSSSAMEFGGGRGWMEAWMGIARLGWAHSLIPAGKLPLPGTHGLDIAAWCWDRLPVLAKENEKQVWSGAANNWLYFCEYAAANAFMRHKRKI